MYSPIPEMIFYYEIDKFVDVFYKLKKNIQFITVWQIHITNFRYGYIAVGPIQDD